MVRNRNWVFTINNWTESDRFAVSLLMKKAKYGIVGKEMGEQGTPHLQGYISLANALELVQIKKFLPRAHLEVALGTDEDNFKYCSKQSDYEEWGQKSVGQGRRTDIKELADKIKNREIDYLDVMFEYPELYMKYSRAIENMLQAVMPYRDTQPEVYWRWGLAGTGKTRYVIETYGSENVYIKDGTPWWNGYRQQKVILIDDFDNAIPYRTLLRILDRYRYQGQVKGGYVDINSEKIFITCEHHPDRYWNGNELAQVMRRLTSVEEIK